MIKTKNGKTRVMSEKMTIGDIAGFCPEEAVWKMMADVSACLLEENAAGFLTPDSILIGGDAFFFETGHAVVSEFLAPEQEEGAATDRQQWVWSLGAVAFYAATGHVVFGGHGGSYQRRHPSVSLPVLPKGMQNLTPVLQRCLCRNPEERIALAELRELSLSGWRQCKTQQRMRTDVAPKNQSEGAEQNGDKWPEKMI